MGVLPGIGSIGAGLGGAGFPTLNAILTTLTLTSNLKVVVDAGDAASYPGSGQTLTNVNAAGPDFNLGDTSSGESSDPTFNGSAGGSSQNEYFSFDGGDYVTRITSTPAYVQTFHKTNALFSSCGWFYLGTTAAYNTAWGDNGDLVANIGASWHLTETTAHPSLVVCDGTGSPTLNAVSTLSPSAGAWQFHSMTMDEAAGNLTFGLNGSYNAQTGKTYPTFSSSNAGFPLQLGAHGQGSGSSRNLQNGSRWAMTGIWQGVALSQANMTAIYNATRTRFGV